MTDALAGYLAVVFAIALISCAMAMAGVPRTNRPFWRTFWTLTGVCGFVNGTLGVGLLLQTPATLGPYLRVCVGLDGLLLAFGAILVTRPAPRWSGGGAAMVVQALLRLLWDVICWQNNESS